MSSVNNYILKTNCSAVSERFVELVNSNLIVNTDEPKNRFIRVTDYAGGTRYLEIEVYLLAGNYVAQPVVIDAIKHALLTSTIRSSHLSTANSIQLFCQSDQDYEHGLIQIYHN